MANVYRPRKGTVFRVRGIPTDWDEELTESFLADHYGAASTPTVQSLGQEIHQSSKTATLMFLDRDFSMPGVTRTNPVWRVPLKPCDGGRRIGNQYLTLDVDFHGITTLFVPPVDDHKLEYLVCLQDRRGIGGHAFGSFKERGGDHMWLRDSIPRDLMLESTSCPMARVMTYGFESTMAESRSVQSLEDLATSLRNSLLAIAGHSYLRPIIFIAHSLGGLIVKEMLILLSKSKSPDDLRIFQVVSGILFFGVPHDGIDISSFILMVGDGPNRSLVESLSSENSQILDTQRRGFYEALTEDHGCEVVCFYETDRSPTAKRGDDGVWRMTGPAVSLVSKASATHCRPWEDSHEHMCAVARNHSEMVKFGPEDHEYDKVRETLKSIARRSLVRWETIHSASDPPKRETRELSQLEQDCLQSLAFPEMNDRFRDIDVAIAGTCGWLLRHETYKTWLGSDKGLLWIRGKPGSGKSTVLRHAFNHATEISDKTLVLSFFFHGRGNDLQKTIVGFFRSIVHQLLCNVPETLAKLVATFRDRRQNMGRHGSAWNWHERELQAAIELSVSKVLQTRNVQLFVDALDEAGEDAAVQLADIFKTWLQQRRETRSSWQICFSCRHYPIIDLDYGFQISTENENGHDIRKYVIIEGSKIPWQVQNTIIHRASGVFMWARLTVARALLLCRQGIGWKKVQEKINATPKELSRLYSEIVISVFEKGGENSLRIIRWICCATRPLTLEELRCAMIVGPDRQYKSLEECKEADDYDSDMEKRVRFLSGGLAELTASHPPVIQFIHQSVPDYFFVEGLWILAGLPVPAQNSLDRITPDEIRSQAEYELSATCLCYMELCQGLLSIQKNKVAPEELPFLGYAERSWVSHTGKITETSVLQRLVKFIEWPRGTAARTLTRVHTFLNGPVTYVPHSSLGRPIQGLESVTLLSLVSHFGLWRLLEIGMQTTGQPAVDINELDEAGVTALHRASSWGHEDLIKVLFKHGAGLEVTRKGIGLSAGFTALHIAARDNRQGVVHLLLECGADINAQDDAGRTPLLHALKHGHRDVAEFLLEKGADARLFEPSSPPLCVASFLGSVQLIRRLLEAGASVEDVSSDNDFSTPLHEAAKAGDLDIVRILFDHGAHWNAKTGRGETPLHYALDDLSSVSDIRKAIVLLLLEKGADLSVGDNRGDTPLHAAVHDLRYFDSGPRIRFLLEHGADVNAQNSLGETPLHCVAWNGGGPNPEALARLLLSYGADLDIQATDGRMPLHYVAAGTGGGRGEEDPSASREILVRLFLKCGANISVKDCKGRTPQETAAVMERTSITEVLMEEELRIQEIRGSFCI